mmetsp:Transcript_4968/g.9347  ORF Transcript_4968/g.9347 Transcript_4968/m.9347 type:complete len:581 (+) Transcript_4968:653-2395(+)
MAASLESLFSSSSTEVFPLELLLSYLSQSQSSTHTYFASLLNQFRIEQIEFFLSQLLYLAMRSVDMKPLHNFLLDSCVWSSKLSLKLYWLCIAAEADQLQWQKSSVSKLMHECEYTIVNGARPPVPNDFLPPHLLSVNLPEDTEFQSCHKEVRAEVFTISIQVASALCEVSVNLVSHQPELRDSILRASLTTISKWLTDQRNHYSTRASEYTQRLLRGAYLPVEFHDVEGVEQIVSILPNESFCYYTRERVPYCLLVETVELNDPQENPGSSKSEELEAQEMQDLDLLGLTEKSRPWGERWAEKKNRLSLASQYSTLESWRLRGFIVKGLDDLRQEHLAMQFIKVAKLIFEETRMKLWLRPYDILVISNNSGLIELVPDALSIDSLKKNCPEYVSLRWFFERYLDLPFEDAQRNFVESMAGYSLICYLLNLKDRHNGNIMLDRYGHIMHIDYGYILTNSPGKNLGFETAPFKLNEELIEVMDGKDSYMYNYYKILMFQGLLALRKHADKLIKPIEVMHPGEHLHCFKDASRAVSELKARFMLEKTDMQVYAKLERLVDKALKSWTTAKYDSYQRYSNGIL